MILALLALVALSACKAPRVIEADVPAEIDRVAVLELGDDGRVARGSNVAVWSRDRGAPIAADDDAVIVGWSSSVLALAGAPADLTALSKGTLAQADGCAPRLPAPGWAATWPADGALVPKPPAEVPPLTVEWLEGQCVELPASPRVDVDVRCGRDRCVPVVRREGRCGLALDLSSCGIGDVHAVVDRSGAMCLDFSASAWRCERRPEDSSSDAPYLCSRPTTCELDAYLELQPRPAPFELEKVAILDATPKLPRRLIGSNSLRPTIFAEGYASDLVVLDDRVVVATSTGAFGETQCFGRERSERRLASFDLEHLLPIATASAPPCLQTLARDPRSNALFATFYDPSSERWMLGRFDAGLHLVHAEPTLALFPTPGLDHYARRIVPAVDDHTLAILFLSAKLDPGRTIVTFHDMDTLAEKRRVPLDEIGSVFGITSSGRGSVLLVSQDSRLVGEVFAERGGFELLEPLPVGQELGEIAIGLYRDAATDRALIHGQGRSTLYALSPTREFAAARAFAEDLPIAELGPWPGGQDIVLASGTVPRAPGERRALLTLYSPSENRFHPGTWDVGFGAAARIRPDASGHLWLLFPWSGELARLTPTTH